MNLYKNSRRLWWDRICKIMCIYSNNKCMCFFFISPVPIAEPLTSELIDTPVFHNLAPRPIKYRLSVPIPSHCWGGMEAQISLTVAFSSSAFFGLLFLMFLLTIPHRFSMFRSGEFAGQSSTPTSWSFNQLLVLLAVLAGAKSFLKIKSASLKSWSAEGSIKCSKISW